MNLRYKGKIMDTGRENFSAEVIINAKRKIMMMTEE